MPMQRRAERMAARRANDGRRRALIVGGVIAVVALLLWPLETLLVGILTGSVAVLLEGVIARAAMRSTPVARDRVLRYGPMIGAAVLSMGVVAVALWTIPMAVATLILALTACAMNAYERWAARQALRPATPYGEVETPAEVAAVAPPAPVQARVTPAPSRRAAVKRRAATTRAVAARTSKRPPAKRTSPARRRTRQST